ncbi:serine hydrolase [Bacillus sp. OK048]|uniref:serine hydrolase domain-containing protein n=1 Tax=Bacillus sp. OK048 TaxID=1882761 RepID=UPI0008900275|nr:serine hydrolase domain-containing protein [Bacillus sp. OK048]SDM85822.1 CubicO group peptidase, beta-lactamase class C family [Bacillus sp. OK048]
MRRKISLFLLALSFFTILLSSHVSAEIDGISDEKLNKVNTYVKEQFQNAGIVGGSYAIVSNNQVIAANGVGYRDIKLEKKAMAETIYPIASVTKSLTATAILQLQEQGKLKVNDRVQKYLPWFTYKDKEKSKEVTIQHLLTHSAGVDRFEADGAIFTDEKKNRNSLENSIRALRTVDMTSNPGKEGQYCNSCFNTLGLLIEEVTGMSYYDYMKTNVFEPLGLEHTAFGEDLKTMESKDIAKEYSWFFGFRNTNLLNYQTFGKSQDPEGGIYTNSLDLAKFVSATLGDETFSLLNQDTLALSYEGVVPTEHKSWQYTNGGFEVGMLSDQRVLYKGGDGIGSSSVVMMLPEENIGVVLLIGESNSEPKQDIAKGMLQILIGGEPTISEFPPPLFKMAGIFMLVVTIICTIILAILGWSFYKRITRENHSIKIRWWRICLMILLLIGWLLIGYLLLFIKITQIGFNGYPYDIAIGLIVIEITLLIGLIYNVCLLLFVKRRFKRWIAL